MLKKFRLLPVVFITFFISDSLNAQSSGFSKINKEDFSSYPAEYDNSESAVVLFDVAKSYFSPQLDVEYERHVRIKILNDDGLKWGEVAIFFYKDRDQDVFNIEGNSYELVDGEIIKNKLNKDDVFEENITADLFAKKFAMPALSKGTIIEYKYRKRYGSAVYLPDWEFHKPIPVQYSEYEMKVPHNYRYNTVLSGVDSSFTSNSQEYLDSRGGGILTTVSKSNIPAVKELPFITTIDDFKTRIFNQLIYVNHNGSITSPFINTWEKIAKEFRTNEDIGRQRLNGDMKDKVDDLILSTDSDFEKAKRIYKYVAENFDWNGAHRISSEKGIRDTFKEGNGNSGDINLMLINMLEHAGLNVNPAFISTKDNGFLITNYPIIYQFNNVVAIVNIDKASFLLDATEGYRNLGQPPVKDLYRVGLMVTDRDHKWIETAPSVNSSKIFFVQHDFSSKDTIRTTISGTIDGYSAEIVRNNNEDDRVPDMLNASDLNSSIDSVHIENLDNPEEALNITIKMSIPFSEISDFNEVIYFNPSFLIQSESPLKDSKRNFPLYFPYPFKERTVTKFVLPEGYSLDEFSKPKTITIGENLARFRYITQAAGNTLTILEDFSVNTTVFSSEDYSSIKNLFDEYYEYKNRPVVLKKISDENGEIEK